MKHQMALLSAITSLLKNLTRSEGILRMEKRMLEMMSQMHVMRNATARGNKGASRLLKTALSNEPENDLVGNHGVACIWTFSAKWYQLLDKIDQNTRALEQGSCTANRLGVAGRTDCVAEYDMVNCLLIDFQNCHTRKRNEINETLSCTRQLSMRLLGRSGPARRLNQIVILTVTEDGDA